jgi:hypothetical protein
MPDDRLKHLCQKLASRIETEWPIVDGHTLRADAGDAGMIYVALRGAKGDLEAGDKLSGELESLLSDALDEEPGDRELDFAISVGSGNKDLLLQIELRYV